jgi:hypothetical protein
MGRFAVLAAVFAALALSACESRTSWIKESAGPGQLDYDQQECRRSASDYGFVDCGVYGGESGRPGSTSMTAEDYRRCMEKRGWRRERTPDQPVGPSRAT